MKLCVKCQVIKEDFSFRKRENTLRSYCRDCENFSYREYYKKNKASLLEVKKNYNKLNKEKNKFRDIKKLYGLSKESYNLMLTAQKGLCYICKNAMKKICIDHCHNTGKVRGLLCNSCNILLGHAKDDISLLSTASLYLFCSQNNVKLTLASTGEFYDAK
jgi:hypothetical protein